MEAVVACVCGSSHTYADRRKRMRIDAEGMHMRIDVDAVVACVCGSSHAYADRR